MLYYEILDQVKIYIKAGNGGDGSLVSEEKNLLNLWPDGGDGGKGGSVILKAEQNLNTLIDFRYQQHHKAERGENGSGQNRTGKGGEDLISKFLWEHKFFKKTTKHSYMILPKLERSLLLPLEEKEV